MKVLLPFIPLRMIPHATRWAGDRVKECVFVTRPNFTKVEVKNYLEKACGLSGIERVDTCNYEGKKKTFTNRKTKKKTFFRRQDFKKAYVKFKEPIDAPPYLLTMKRNAEEVNRREATAQLAEGE